MNHFFIKPIYICYILNIEYELTDVIVTYV